MTERMIWGMGAYPAGSTTDGLIRHPADGMLGVAIKLINGTLVHGAAGVIRALPKPKLNMWGERDIPGQDFLGEPVYPDDRYR